MDTDTFYDTWNLTCLKILQPGPFSPLSRWREVTATQFKNLKNLKQVSEYDLCNSPLMLRKLCIINQAKLLIAYLSIDAILDA